MTPAHICRAAYEAGLTLRADGSQLVVTPARRLTPPLRKLLIAHKSALLSFLADAHRTATRLVEVSQSAPATLWQPDLFDTHQEPTGRRRDPDGITSGVSTWNLATGAKPRTERSP